MRFVVGCDFGEFKKYYNKTVGNLGNAEEYWVRKNASHLIVWRENNEIVGHAIWHESNTDEHKMGDPRDKEDKKMLKSLLGEKNNFVELHEVWLAKKHRGKGYGRKFFKFFEEFVRTIGRDAIIYYAYHPVAIAICRQRGYEEAYGLEAKGLEGKMETMYIFYLKL